MTLLLTVGADATSIKMPYRLLVSVLPLTLGEAGPPFPLTYTAALQLVTVLPLIVGALVFASMQFTVSLMLSRKFPWISVPFAPVPRTTIPLVVKLRIVELRTVAVTPVTLTPVTAHSISAESITVPDARTTTPSQLP